MPGSRFVDLQYHDVNRERGVFYRMQRKGMVDRIVTDEEISHAVEHPPQTTRLASGASSSSGPKNASGLHRRLGSPEAQRPGAAHRAVQGPVQSRRRTSRQADRAAVTGRYVMDKLERLLNLTAALLHAEIPLTAEELRDRVGGYPDTKATFRRAFERDKDDLRSMGMPLRVEPVPGVDPPVDGYRLDRDEYAGTELAFEADELAALHLATSLVRLDGDDTALVKLGAAGGNAPTDSVGRVPFNDTLATMIGAPSTGRPWRSRTTTSSGSSSRGSCRSRGHWYLSGFDRLREDQRLYRADRIEGDVSLSGPAEAPVGDVNEPIDLRGWELGDGPAVEATIVVDADQAAYARHILGDVVDQPDGSVTATLDVRNIDAFRSFVLSFLEHAEILEPADLRSDFVEWLEAQQ